MSEIYKLNEDVQTFCVMAHAFPGDAQGCHARLRALLPTTAGRVFYGISHGDADGNIIYRAAVAEKFEGEAEQYSCERFTILAGQYLSQTIMQWQQNMGSMGAIFQEMIHDPRLDPMGYCVEWYKSDTELLCMAKLADTNL